jgi:hypothetical protein
MKNSRANKGQFSIIAALLVSVILVTAVISTYTMVRHAPLQDSPKVLTAIGEMNADIKQILDFTVGYYGSILKVTGNSTYAKGLTTSYLSSGLVNIARSHPEWNPSFELNSQNISTCWFMPESYSMGRINITYSLEALGIEGVIFTTSSALSVEMLNSSSPDIARLNVTRDNSEPELGLNNENFWFYKYNYDNSTWELVNPNPTDVIISSNGTYTITIPSGVNQDAYSVQVEDNRGLIVPAFYSQESVTSESKVPHYTYTFNWDASGMLDIYEDLSTDNFAIEVLQNGTLKWLGQPLELTSNERPIPPICIKALRINATIDGNTQEVPFQVEDWASDYMVPLGLSGNESIFNNNNMLVFLVNNNIDEVTVWWDGNDTAIQTPYAWQNVYFNDDVLTDPDNGQLSNGLVDLTVAVVRDPPPYGDPKFRVTSTMGASTSTAEFLRINSESPIFWADTAYVIYDGVVRDIVQQEPEYDDGAAACPNFYTQIVLTLPANATYYTYALRTIFVDSTQSRTITDLSAVQLSGEWVVGELMSLTENGTAGGYPVLVETSTGSTDLFCNSSSPEGWQHHWSEYVLGDSGGGLMFTNRSNFDLYSFDDLAGDYTGSLKVTSEYNPFWTTPTSVYDRCGQDGGHPASNTIDGNTNSYWRHSATENHWITFDMGETIPISRIRIYQQSYDWGGSDGIEIYVSDDPENWGSPVWSGRIDGNNWETSGSFSAEGRYVKLVTLSTSSSQRLYEVQVQTHERRGTVEFNPVEQYQVTDFYDTLDITWYGAVVTFDGEPIYRSSDDVGLWVMVEHPPSVTVN